MLYLRRIRLRCKALPNPGFPTKTCLRSCAWWRWWLHSMPACQNAAHQVGQFGFNSCYPHPTHHLYDLDSFRTSSLNMNHRFLDIQRYHIDKQKILLEISCVGNPPCFVVTATWPYPPIAKIQYDFQRNKPPGLNARSVSRILQEISKKNVVFSGPNPPSFIVFGSRNPKRKAQTTAMLPLCRYYI